MRIFGSLKSTETAHQRAALDVRRLLRIFGSLKSTETAIASRLRSRSSSIENFRLAEEH